MSAGPDGSAWAVGYTCTSRCGTSFETDRTLILHRNRGAWSRSASPSPGAGAGLESVSAGPDGSAWAVGYSCTGCGSLFETDRTLILHWDGTAWSPAASPSPGDDAILEGVSAGPDGSAWAVGYSCTGCGTSFETDRTLILHWNGTAWSRSASPSLGAGAILFGVSAGPDGSAWAAGYTCRPSCDTPTETQRTLILHWDGTAWSRSASPSPGGSAFLNDVSAGPDGSAWAVGGSCTPRCFSSSATDRTLILHWDGAAWSRSASPSLGSAAVLWGVSTGPAGSAQAVGYTCSPRCFSSRETTRTLIVRWTNGAWSAG